jgi:hypothetical protein
MGITKRDIKVLLGALNDIRLCHSFAAMAGLTFGQTFSTWLKGVPASQAALGIVLLARQRLEMALISLAVVAILAIALWALLAAANRNARILQSLKGKRR